MDDQNITIDTDLSAFLAQVAPAETLSDKRGLRLVRLNFSHDQYNGVHEYLAELGEGLVTFLDLRSDGKPKKFTMSPQHMTKLAHAWLTFVADQQALEKAETSAWQAEVAAVCVRAANLGFELKANLDIGSYPAFDLICPKNHPLGHILKRFVGLSLGSVSVRLDAAEHEKQQVQNEKVSAIMDTQVQLARRADAIGAVLYDDEKSEGMLCLSFPSDHSFYGFWTKIDNLTPGMVEYRLRYVEGVLNPDTDF